MGSAGESQTCYPLIQLSEWLLHILRSKCMFFLCELKLDRTPAVVSSMHYTNSKTSLLLHFSSITIKISGEQCATYWMDEDQSEQLEWTELTEGMLIVLAYCNIIFTVFLTILPACCHLTTMLTAFYRTQQKTILIFLHAHCNAV